MNDKHQSLVQKVLAAESIPPLTDDPVHDALASAYYRADAARNVLVLSLSELPSDDTASDKVSRARVGVQARIAGTEDLRQILKRLILHCRGGAREMLANLSKVDLNVGLNVLRMAHVALRSHMQARISIERVYLQFARYNRLETLKKAADVVADYLHACVGKDSAGSVCTDSTVPGNNPIDPAPTQGDSTVRADSSHATDVPRPSPPMMRPAAPIEFWHENREAILLRLGMDPARQDQFSTLEEVFSAILRSDMSLDDTRALIGIHQLSFIACLAHTAESFHPTPDPATCPMFHEGRGLLVQAQEQLAKDSPAKAIRVLGEVEHSDADDLELELCRLGQISKALIWLGHHEPVIHQPTFETYISSRVRVQSIRRMIESVVMLLEEISKVKGTSPEDCHLYRVLCSHIAPYRGQ